MRKRFNNSLWLVGLLLIISMTGCGGGGGGVWTKPITGAGTANPTVSSTLPVNDAAGVSINADITATFSKAMDPATIVSPAANFTLKEFVSGKPVAGIVTYAGNTATFNPTADLTPATKYTATIATGAKDQAGNALAANYTWSFTTLPVVPSVTLTAPADVATQVCINRDVTATFSKAMDPATIVSPATNFTLKESVSGTSVAGAVTYVGNTATFNPTINLTPGIGYTATVTTGVRDLAGNALAANKIWTFTAGTATCAQPVALGVAAPFAGLSGGAGVTNQGIFTVINGDMGTTAASTLVTGFHDTGGNVYTETPLNIGTVNGTIYTATAPPGSVPGAIAAAGALAAQNAFNNLSPAVLPGGIDVSTLGGGAGELGGRTLAPGIYKSAPGAFAVSLGDLTLDAAGDANAVWVFQMGTTLTVGIAGPAGARSVKLINGAQAKNVFWQVGSAATINAAGGGTMAGTIISSAATSFSTAGNVAITTLEGRALSLTASVTVVNTHINVPAP